jgi:hypothetical protein
MNINQLIIDLNNAWRTEVNSPVILPFHHQLVADVKEALLTQSVEIIS